MDTSIDKTSKQRELENAILEKEILLAELLADTERLKVDLSVLKKEYDVKIGRLYLKLDKIDLEILEFKEIEDLISKGLSFKEAQMVVGARLKDRQEQIREEYEKLNREESEVEKHKKLSDEERDELKKLYRKLAYRYHPDLTCGDDAIMKKINAAYAQGDLEILRLINKEEVVIGVKELALKDLENKLKALEVAIQKVDDEFKNLQDSEWSILRSSIDKAKEQNRDVLSELSEKILSEISKKEKSLNELKQAYEQR